MDSSSDSFTSAISSSINEPLLEIYRQMEEYMEKNIIEPEHEYVPPEINPPFPEATYKGMICMLLAVFSIYGVYWVYNNV